MSAVDFEDLLQSHTCCVVQVGNKKLNIYYLYLFYLFIFKNKSESVNPHASSPRLNNICPF